MLSWNESIDSWYIMLKDIKVCTISKNGNVNILRDELLPFDIYLEEENDFDTCVNNLVNFYAWCANRILSIDRTNAKAILNSVNLKQVTTDKDKAAIALQFKCLSLRDSYWVTDNISDKWSTLNLFENSLNNIIDISLLGKYLTVTNEKLVIDDLSTAGVAPKAWVRSDNIFILYKGGNEVSVRNEVIASKELIKLGFNVVEYTLDRYDNCLVSKSKCFTNTEVGLVTAGDYNYNFDLIDLVNGTYKNQFWEMILCDYLVGNSDRHQDNWGILIDSNRNILSLSPIFDFDHVFQASPEFISLPLQLLGMHKTMIEAAKEAVSIVNTDIKLLKSKTDNEFILSRLKLLE